MTPTTAQRLCLYCGEPTKKGGKGEHIVPKAIGGRLTLNDFPTDRVVCGKCNNEVLARIDDELCTRSYLSFVASQQIDGHLWQVWDVDHSAGHVLVEARPLWAADKIMNSLVPYPQVTFERTGPEVRGDAEEFQRFGLEDAGKVLFKTVRQAFGRWCHTGRGLHFERIESGVIKDGYRLPPRVFLRHTLGCVW